MSQGTKLILDLVFGAVIPIAVLTYLTQSLTAPVAYVAAALIPVAWVAIDLLFITRRFNFITSYVGLSAIVSGILAFWFVDGLLFALKDSASFMVAVAVFAGSLLVGQPLINRFFAQIVRTDSPQRHAELYAFLKEPGMRRSVVLATVIILVVNSALAVINFWLNATIVVAPFGVDEFNRQVAQVNAITRIAFPIPSIAAFAGALFIVFRAAYKRLPVEPGLSPFDVDFWESMDRRQLKDTETTTATVPQPKATP